MQLLFSYTFLQKIFLSVKKDFIFLKKIFTFILMSFIGFKLFLSEFSFMEYFFGKIGMFLMMLLLGLIFTNLPNYIIVIMAFFPFKYTWVVYIISFVYMFLI